jgi:hypothetical protein
VDVVRIWPRLFIDARNKSGHDREVRIGEVPILRAITAGVRIGTFRPPHGVIAGLVPAIHEQLMRSRLPAQDPLPAPQRYFRRLICEIIAVAS